MDSLSIVVLIFSAVSGALLMTLLEYIQKLSKQLDDMNERFERLNDRFVELELTVESIYGSTVVEEGDDDNEDNIVEL